MTDDTTNTAVDATDPNAGAPLPSDLSTITTCSAQTAGGATVNTTVTVIPAPADLPVTVITFDDLKAEFAEILDYSTHMAENAKTARDLHAQMLQHETSLSDQDETALSSLKAQFDVLKATLATVNATVTDATSQAAAAITATATNAPAPVVPPVTVVTATIPAPVIVTSAVDTSSASTTTDAIVSPVTAVDTVVTPAPVIDTTVAASVVIPATPAPAPDPYAPNIPSATIVTPTPTPTPTPTVDTTSASAAGVIPAPDAVVVIPAVVTPTTPAAPSDPTVAPSVTITPATVTPATVTPATVTPATVTPAVVTTVANNTTVSDQGAAPVVNIAPVVDTNATATIATPTPAPATTTGTAQ